MPSRALTVSGAVEGLVDEAALRRLVREAGGTTGAVYGRNGKPSLRRALAGYNNAARFSPWVVLVDLDQEADCAPPLVLEWLPAPASMMRFRVAVREVESWILADSDNLPGYLGVPRTALPHDPDAVRDPKQFLVDVARRSRKAAMRADLVPRPGSGRPTGPAYTSRMIEFLDGPWDPRVAERRSDSLRRCRVRLAELFAGPSART